MRYIKSAVFLVLLSFLMLGSTAGSQKSYYHPHEIPNPMISRDNAELCGRSGVPKSTICDPNRLVSDESKNVIEGFINSITEAQVGVTVISKMAPSFAYNLSPMKAGEKFARQVHTAWGVGDKTSNNGVFVFLSVEDRVAYISTGQGVQHLLSTSVIESIVENMKTYLRKQVYGQALEHCTGEIKLVMSGDPKYAALQKLDNEIDWANVLFVVVIVAGVAAFMYREYRKDQQLQQVSHVRTRATFLYILDDVITTIIVIIPGSHNLNDSYILFVGKNRGVVRCRNLSKKWMRLVAQMSTRPTSRVHVLFAWKISRHPRWIKR
jgi:hypothetical protein